MIEKIGTGGDGFGKYVVIKTGACQEEHVYKVVSKLHSNCWQNTPILFGENPVHHDEMENILLVIHCGVDESKVLRVAEKDCRYIKSVRQFTPEEKKKIVNTPITPYCFDIEPIHEVTAWDSLSEVSSTHICNWVEDLEYYRRKYLQYKEEGYFEVLVRMLPKGYNVVDL